MLRGWRAVRGGVALLAVAALAHGCAEIIGVPSETESIATDFCKCEGDENLDTAWPGETCIAHVEGRLSTAEPDVLRGWLDTYAENDCGNCQNLAGRQACKSAAPICAAVGASCQSTAFCCTPPGQETYCGDQNVCVSEGECTPPFASCDPEASNCCGEVGFKARCVGDSPETARCLESCDPADPVNCPGCCAFFGEITAQGPDGEYLCVSGTDCQETCDPPNGDACAIPGTTCHPTVQVFGNITTIDACLPDCDPDGQDTCGSDACCVRFRDLTTSNEVGRCVETGQGVCNRLCRTQDENGVAETCQLGISKCAETPLPVGPAGPFSIFLCRNIEL